MRRAWSAIQKVCLILFVGLVASNVLLPAVARAQFVAESSGASAADIIAALVGQDVSVNKMTVTAPAGAVALQMANEGALLCAGAPPNYCIKKDLSLEMLAIPGSFALGAGANLLADAQYPRQDAIPFEFRGSKGYRHVCIAAGSLPTCGSSAAPQSTELTICAASSVATRKCICTSDGAGTPAWAWVNTLTGTVGTSTTCSP